MEMVGVHQETQEENVLTCVHPCLCATAGDRAAPPVLKQQFSISELTSGRGDSQHHLLGAEETGLQDHTQENCLYCVGATVLGYPTQPQVDSTHAPAGRSTCG